MRLVLILATAATLWQAVTRDTNSQAASARGSKAYADKKYDVSAREFRSAASIAPSPQRAFNLGTAQIAAGQRTEGSATLSGALRDPAYRPDALYNRGNSALAARAYEHAIRDYKDALRLRPDDAQAKRNLEIALTQLESARKQASGKEPQPQQPQKQSQQQPSPSAKPEGPRQEADTEAILRSVQQQEQEELARMKRARASRARVGW